MGLSCRLFGHRFALATRGMTAINGKPVFVCWCGVIWAPTIGAIFVHQLASLGRRDQIERYHLLTIADIITT